MSNKKSVKKNYIYNVLYQILTIIIPVITTPYLSRVLGAEKIGIYSYTLSIATYFVLIGSLGISLYGQREIAYVQDDVEKRSKTFLEIFIMKCITMILAIIVFYITFCTKGDYSIYYKILILEIIANIIDISWLLQGMEEFKKTVIRNTIVKVLGVICIFIFIKNQDDLYKYFLIYVLSNTFGNITLWGYIKKYIKKISFGDLNIKRHIKPAILLFIPQVAIQVYTLLDKTMLGLLSNEMTNVGFYEQSQKIIKTALVLVTSLGTVVAPRIASIIASGKKKEVSNYLEKSYHFVWLVGFPLMTGLIAISKTLIPWFLGEEFFPSISITMVGAILIMAIGLNNVSGMQYLIPSKKQNLFTKSVVVAAIVNFTLNYIFIPKYGAMGAIVASVIAEILTIFIQSYDIRKDINIKIIVKDSLKYIVGSIIMFIPVYLIGVYMQPKIYTTVFQVFVGVIVYGLYLLIIKDHFLIDYFSKIFNKIRRN